MSRASVYSGIVAEQAVMQRSLLRGKIRARRRMETQPPLRSRQLPPRHCPVRLQRPVARCHRRSSLFQVAYIRATYNQRGVHVGALSKHQAFGGRSSPGLVAKAFPAATTSPRWPMVPPQLHVGLFVRSRYCLATAPHVRHGHIEPRHSGREMESHARLCPVRYGRDHTCYHFSYERYVTRRLRRQALSGR